jgi:hypothetical protein
MKNLLVGLRKNYTMLKFVLAASGPISTVWLIYIGILLGQENFAQAFLCVAGFVLFEFVTTLLWWHVFELSKHLDEEE